MSVEQTPAPEAPVQDPEPAAAPTAAAPPSDAPSLPTPAPVSGPWSEALNTRFSDEAVRAEVDSFLRETVQPHVTKIEQGAKPAQELYEAFRENPDTAFAQIAKELYGDEEATAITDYLDSLDEPAIATTPPEPAAQRPPSRFREEPAAENPTRDPEVQRLIDEDKSRKAEAAFEREFARVSAANPDLEIDRELFAPFAARASSIDNAVVNYRAYVAKVNAKYAEPGAAPAPAPPTLGSDAVGGGPPPTVPAKQSLHQAIEDFAELTRAGGSAVAPPIP